MLGHLVLVHNPAHAQANVLAGAELAGVNPGFDLAQTLFGGHQQLFAFVRAQFGQLRIATRHQSLARVLWRGEFEQIALVKQTQLQLPLLDQRADRAALERGDPADALHLAHLLDGLLRDHAAVTHHHHAFDTEVIAQLLHRRHERLAVCGVALVHRHCHRAAPRIGEQPIVDLQRALAPITAVAPTRELTAMALEVARGQVIQDQAIIVQMACSQLLLDGALARVQPVHGRIQIVLARMGHPEVLGQRGGVPPARGGQLG